MIPVTIILMAFVGLALGLLGSGGSIITLPVLVYVAFIPSHQAIAMSLVIVGGTSAMGSLLNLRRGSFDLRAALLFISGGFPGSFLGASFTHLVSARILLVCFGTLLLITGWRMLFGSSQAQPASQRRPSSCLIIGFVVGILTGFLGVGGGIIVLPALVLFAGLEMKVAIGTSLAVITANCLAGLVGQLRYISFEWPLTLAFLAAATAGMFGGLAAASHVSSQSLRRAFAMIIIATGVFLLLNQAFAPPAIP